MKNKPYFYQALKKIGWNLPIITSCAVTLKFLNDVRDEIVFCPKTTNHRIDCCDVPRIDYLMQEVNRLTNQNYWWNARKYPNIQWAVDVIAAKDANHKIFKKNFIAKPKILE